MATTKTALLDLIDDGPRYSDVFEFGSPPRRYKWRLLDSIESMSVIALAEAQVFRELTDAGFDRETAIDLLKGHAPNIDLQTTWTELFALQAALCDEHGAPVVTGAPADRAHRLGDLFSPPERFELAQLYGEFADEFETVQVSDDQLQEIIAAEGPISDPSFWRRYGSSLLRRFCHTLAVQNLAAQRRIAELEAELEALDTSPTDRSEDG